MNICSNIFILFFLLFVFHFNCAGQSIQKFINPTGTYALEAKSIKRDGETFGYYGSIQVQLIDSARIKILFFVCKGAPSYNSGSFIKILSYDGRKAVFTESDSTEDCMTTFIFQKKGINVYENPNVKHYCWGTGVVANGFFIRKSTKQPIFRDPLTNEIIAEMP